MGEYPCDGCIIAPAETICQHLFCKFFSAARVSPLGGKFLKKVCKMISAVDFADTQQSQTCKKRVGGKEQKAFDIADLKQVQEKTKKLIYSDNID
jgi:hypothetical protein|uniref:Uncharacterized protein n=1 Tax=Caudovirales sp. ctqPn17 TaxID=2825772 RepID=A0A8S5QFG7_9CAUD|nr:MAG TPA: hypothetical protein [Caudovirales sp. ctqPn17]